jgi:hypothetical protein
MAISNGLLRTHHHIIRWQLNWTAVREYVAIHNEVLQRDLGNQITEPWKPTLRILLKTGIKRESMG